MKYLIDTNICIYIIKKKPEKVIKRFLECTPGDICISSITVSELYYGIEKSSRYEQNLIALQEFLIPFEIINFTEKEGAVYGKIRNYLDKKGRPIGAMDLLIAAQAVSNNLILITNNEKEFKRIMDLKIENWAK